jgi:hypothetical protein
MYGCGGCGRNIEKEDAHTIEIICGKTMVCFYLCSSCLIKHNNGQLNLEHLQFSFPLQARQAARVTLNGAF